MTSTTKRRFTDEFKREAVALWETSGRTIGIARARIKIGMASLACNIQRLAWLEGRGAPA